MSGVDESDLMKGLSHLRHYVPSLQERIKDFESESNWSEALNCYEQGLQVEPDRLEYHTGLLRCLRNLGHLRTAVTHVQGTLIV